MDRYTIILLALLLIVAAAIGAVWFLRTNAPSSSVQGTPSVTFPAETGQTVPSQSGQSQAAVQSAFKSGIAPYVTDNLKLQQTVIAGDYAIQVWSSDSMGGQALLQYDSVKGSWMFITAGGGAWTVGDLVGAGVPQNTATTLMTDLSQ